MFVDNLVEKQAEDTRLRREFSDRVNAITTKQEGLLIERGNKAIEYAVSI